MQISIKNQLTCLILFADKAVTFTANLVLKIENQKMGKSPYWKKIYELHKGRLIDPTETHNAPGLSQPAKPRISKIISLS